MSNKKNKNMVCACPDGTKVTVSAEARIMNKLKKQAKRTGVPLTLVRNGKRVAKTRAELLRDIESRNRRDEMHIKNRVRKLEAKLPEYWSWKYSTATPRVITEGIKLWKDMKDFYKKRGMLVPYITYNRFTNKNSILRRGFFGDLNSRGAAYFRAVHQGTTTAARRPNM